MSHRSTAVTPSLRPPFLLSLLFLFVFFLLLLPSLSHQPPADKHFRNKRQIFNFSMNTPAPAETGASTSSGAPDLPGSDAGGLGSSGSDSSNDCGNMGAFLCLFLQCQNGGQCYLANDSSCTPKCRCPAPFNDPDLYDEKCGRKNYDSDNSSSDPPPSPCPLPCDNGECRSTNDLGTGFYCECTGGFVGDFCETPCSRNCSNGGVCHVDTAQGKEVCVCPSPWVGAYCTEIPPDETPDTAWVYWLVGSLAVGLALVIIVAALVIYCLWKKRLVFAMKIVYYFKSYEDNDGLLYDAFVSYVSRPKDEDFVHTHLRPKLEQELGFRLCLHQRDFTIGETISNNICGTLENSRRFILVLTPQYLESEWAEFEYQKAFHEMLKLKMRIVPIILEEIASTSTINPTLKAILESVTYITYPGCEATEHQLDKFWKRVHLSMPKIKSKDATELETLKYSVDGEKIVESRDVDNDKVSATLAYVKYRPDDDKTVGHRLAENGKVYSVDESGDAKEANTLKSTDGEELNLTFKCADGESLNGRVAENEDESLKSIDLNALKERAKLLSPASLTDSGISSSAEDDSLGCAEKDTSDSSSVAEDDPIPCEDELIPIPCETVVTRL